MNGLGQVYIEDFFVQAGFRYYIFLGGSGTRTTTTASSTETEDHAPIADSNYGPVLSVGYQINDLSLFLRGFYGYQKSSNSDKQELRVLEIGFVFGPNN